MTDETRDSIDVFGQMVDELRLQAWLAAAEFRNPSMNDPATREEISALAAMRDQLRLQMHLGRLEARDEWHKAEARWRTLKRLASHGMSEIGESLRDVLQEIREDYRHLGAPREEVEV